MCGICGFLRLDGAPLDRAQAGKILRSMNDALSHRGPDDEGIYISGPVALGHRRLSIIDLGGGHQPLGNEEGSVQIVFNGEIYEFSALRRRLEGRGHRFATRCDTEVIVHAWEEWGSACLDHLHGMFAWALWDDEQQRLFLARDRMGKKPLYHAVAGPYLVFASELKSLVRHPDVQRRLSAAALRSYLAFESVPAPQSIYENVYKLEPGFYADVQVASDSSETWRTGLVPGRRQTAFGEITVSRRAAEHARLLYATEPRSRTVRGLHPPLDAAHVQAERRLAARAYWDIDFTPALQGIDVIEAEREIVRRLTESVGRRLVSDVPLGVFLSGGIDSSSVVALMREHKAARDIRTFSIAFQEKSFDESSYARRVAGLFGTTHKEQRLHPRRLLDILPEVFRTLDEPFADPSFVPTYLLSGFTRRHVTVALGGDGGDELFAGYDPFTADAPGRWLGVFPGGMLRMLRSAADLLPVSTKNISFDFKVKKFLEGLPFPERYRHFVWLGSFDPTLHEDILAPGLFHSVSGLDPFHCIDRYLEQLDGRRGSDSLNAVIYLYCKLYLQDGILVKVDRASMAHSLEVRAPFLDTEFVEYVSRLPASWKLRRKGLSVTTKWILKRAMERRLPEDILYRKKKGFGIPIAAWFRGPLREELQRALSPQRLSRQGIFQPEAVRRYVREHLEGRQNHAKRLWTLLCFQRWWDEHGSGSG